MVTNSCVFLPAGTRLGPELGGVGVGVASGMPAAYVAVSRLSLTISCVSRGISFSSGRGQKKQHNGFPILPVTLLIHSTRQSRPNKKYILVFLPLFMSGTARRAYTFMDVKTLGSRGRSFVRGQLLPPYFALKSPTVLASARRRSCLASPGRHAGVLCWRCCVVRQQMLCSVYSVPDKLEAACWGVLSVL